MLVLKHVSKSYDGVAALSDVSLTIPTGATHALIGSSGSGKTTLLRLTLRQIAADQGSIQINGNELSAFDPEAWSDQIGYVPQEGGLFPHLTGAQNVTLVPRLRRWTPSRLAARLAELQRLVALDDSVLRRFPHEMSGGQKQRLAIMRAVMLDPPVVLLDEPLAALDPLIRSSLQQDLKLIFQRLGKTVLIVTHDLGEAVFVAQQLTLLHEGRIVQTGSFEDLVAKPASAFVSAFINAQRLLPHTKVLA
jgi:osmoprotectant transport system ATP-binding protein